MYKNICILLPLIVFIFACNNPATNEPVTDVNKDTSVSKQIESSKKQDINVALFDQVEKFFNNDNWLLIQEKDSCYYYFSRIGKGLYNTYNFKIIKGDSINISTNNIEQRKDSLFWLFKNGKTQVPLYLENVNEKQIVWADHTNRVYYTFTKENIDKIKLELPTGKILTLTKTPTLSNFLIRSAYDYKHGTHLAFNKK